MNVAFSTRGLGFASATLCGLLAVRCGGAGTTPASTSGGSSGTGAASGMGATSGEGAASGEGASGGTGATSGKGGSGSGGRPPNVGGGNNVTPGGENCGLGDKAAFCETFDAPAANQGRAGELDVRKWSGARNQPQSPSGGGRVVGISEATLPTCRSGLPAKVFPSQDAVICDANDKIGSNHLLIAAASQNYGQNSYRIRQPFDFGGRTGKIVFDGEGFTLKLLGWISLEVTEDPTPAPSYALGDPGTRNEEGSAVPKRGFQLQFSDACDGEVEPHVSVRPPILIEDYVQTVPPAGNRVCVTSQAGSLNHFEVSVSQGRIEVWATPFSSDGVGFAAPIQLLGQDVNLPFSRGYVSLTAHNHATKKYSEGGAVDAWIARFDNVGFDGPVIGDIRDYEVPDALVQVSDQFSGELVMNVGYRAADVSEGPSDTLRIQGVDLDGMSSARLAVSAWFLASETNADYALRFRVNGGEWRDRPLSDLEVGQLNDSHNQGQITFMIDVPFSDLVDGENTLEFVSEHVPQNYPPAVWNIDLVLAP